MKSLPRLAIRYRAITLMALALTLYYGVVSFQKLPRRDMPSIPVPIAQIITQYPGATAEDTEALITKPIEMAATEINDVKAVYSTSRPGISVVNVELVYGSPNRPNWEKLRNKIDLLKPRLPQGISGPDINDEFVDTAAILLSVSGKRFTYRQLRKHAETIRDRLKQIDAVGKVDIVGAQQEVVNLYIRKGMAAQTLPSIFQAAATLQSKNVLYPGAEFFIRDMSVKLMTSGKIQGTNGLKKIILAQNPQTRTAVTVGDLFGVERTYKTPKHLIRHQGRKAVIVSVTMRTNQNVIKLGTDVDRALSELKGTLPAGIVIDKVSDQPALVKKSIKDFMINLGEAIAIVLVVAFLFMGFRSGLVIAIAIPTSMLITFMVMKAIGWDLQKISIASLIIALGMLVDNAIVITDNIYSKMQDGVPRFEAAWKGASELSTPVLVSTLTTVAIFFPLGMMPSISGDFIRSIPVVVSSALLSSFAVAMIFTPLTGYYFLKPKAEKAAAGDATEQSSGWLGRIADWTNRYYTALMRVSLGRPLMVIGIAVGVFAASVAGFFVVGKTFFPKAESDMFIVDVWLPEGGSVAATARTVKKVEAILKKEKRIRTFTAFVGRGAPRFNMQKQEPPTPHYATVVVTSRSEQDTPKLAKKLQTIFDRNIPDARVVVRQFERGPSVGDPVQIRIFGDDLSVLRKLADQVKDHLRKIPGTYDITDTLGYRLINIQADVDRFRTAMVGLDNLSIAKFFKTATDGYSAGSFMDGDDEIPIMIRAPKILQERLGAFSTVSVPLRSERSSAYTSVLEVVKMSPRWDVARISRRSNQRYVTVSCNVQGVLASKVTNKLKPKLAAMGFPAGYRYETAGEDEKRSEGFSDLGSAMILGIAAIIVLLVIQFNSFRHMFVVLGSLPLAMVGAILGLYITRNDFGFMAFLGVVSLCGVVVNNALVLLDYVKTRLENGEDYIQALTQAGLRRMRPILLTTFTTVGGLIRLYLTGGAMWNAMAAVLIFGLLVATLLTLVVIPCVYAAVVGDREQKALQSPDGAEGETAEA